MFIILKITIFNCGFSAKLTTAEKHIEIIRVTFNPRKKTKFQTDKGFKGTVAVNRADPSLNRG